MQRPPLIDFSLPDPPQIWLTVFFDPPAARANAPWPNRVISALLRLLRPGFRHVLALSPQTEGGWLVCNPGSCHLGLGWLSDRQVLPRLRTARGATIITVVARRPQQAQLRGLFTCASIIAHLTGIPAQPWVTPHGLWRRMTRMRQ